MKLLLLFILFPFALFAQPFSASEVHRWEQQTKNVTVIRDNWGIPHVYGKTDADAVFGLMYAQCEDDFKRVEMNYIEKLGRLSEVNGEKDLYNDLYTKLIINEEEAMDDYENLSGPLKKLLNAFADGINYYLYRHTEVKPLLLKKFEPWFPLLWTDGSIGAISTGDVTTEELKAFYTGKDVPVVLYKEEENTGSGSNGFAVGPSKTVSGNAILYINPHVTFYYRPEVHMVSEQPDPDDTEKRKLNAYGAVTWGQFFVYQGFNEHCGWMHTSSNADVSDMYEEKIIKNDSGLFYKYNYALKRVTEKTIAINCKTNKGTEVKNFTAWFTHHGPIMTKRDGKYISVKSFNRSVTSFAQSWMRTKAKGFDDFKKIMNLRGNTSNNTVFADDKGNIAYWHGNHIPKRDETYDWGKPVDGSIINTEWMGLHTLDETVHVYNPSTGFIQNCNSTPFTVSGGSSPQPQNYYPYMAPDGENFRGINAARLLQGNNAFDIDKMIAVGYNRQLAAFEILIPALVKAYEENADDKDSLLLLLAGPVAELKKWNYAMEENSVATLLAIEWAERLPASLRKVYIQQGEKSQVDAVKEFAQKATASQLLPPLLETIIDLQLRYNTWKITWGTVNRYQRISDEIIPPVNDDSVSHPIGFASGLWGALPAYSSKYFPGTGKRYGVGGNSFICAVEFGKKIKAKSLLAGGQSGHKENKHFNDQLLMYTIGQFKDVLFYKEDILKNAERQYHPGE